MVRLNHARSGRFGEREVDGGAVAEMRGEGGAQRVGEESSVGCGVGLEAEGSEVAENVASGVGGGFCSGEVRVQGEGAEVGGDGGVGRSGEEEGLEVRGVEGSGKRCI